MCARCRETNWTQLEADWSAWWDGRLDRPLIWIEWFDGPEAGPWDLDLFLPNEPDLSAEAILEKVQTRLARLQWAGDAVPRWWPNLGAGVLAAWLGARLVARPETVWFAPPGPESTQGPPEQIRFQADPGEFWWQLTGELTRKAARRLAGQMAVGYTDLGGNLDILASFRTTEQLLLDLVDHPEQIDRLVSQVTQYWLDRYQRLTEWILPAGTGTTPWAPIWSPQTTYMLQSDFAYMISPEMFDRFVLPDLEACCRAIDHPFYHLDGVGQLVHLDSILEIDSLRGVQWVSGDGKAPPATWFDVQGRILQAGKRIQTWATRAEAIDLIRNVGPKGLVIQIVDCHSRADASEFLEAVARLVSRT